MKKMILLFSHKITPQQIADAKSSFGVEKFIALDENLQQIWSNIPANLENLVEYLKPIRNFLIEQIEVDDVVLIQGDFGATCAMASFVKSLGGVAVYATTKR
ncbi:MAG: hypothetical protein KAU90_03880, partial [Sulfurovaceae bacterium]|nr:hypothetical protein [Sulfurovaceae bacterium]